MAGEVLLNISKDGKGRTVRFLTVREPEPRGPGASLKNDNFLKS